MLYYVGVLPGQFLPLSNMSGWEPEYKIINMDNLSIKQHWENNRNKIPNNIKFRLNSSAAKDLCWLNMALNG